MQKKEAVKIAIDIANKKYGKMPEREFFFFEEGEFIEDSDIWYIPLTSNYLGIGGIRGAIVDKQTGESMLIGGIGPTERTIWGFKRGIRDYRLDFEITRIFDKKKTLELLEDLGLSYVKPEFEHGVLWKTPKSFSQEELENRISNLPCIFKNQTFNIYSTVIDEVFEKKVFEFEIKPTYFDFENILGELIDNDNLLNLQ